MPITIVMPKLSDTMETGKLIKWLKKEGEKVSPGEPIAEAESDKATLEIEAADAGIMARHVVAEGADVPVGGLIAVMAGKGESVEEAAKAASAPPVARAVPTNGGTAPPKVGGVPPRGASLPPSGAGVPPSGAAVPSSGAAGPPGVAVVPPAGVPSVRDGGAPVAPGRRLRSSPLARRLAKERGLDLGTLRGSGPQGRIVARDVQSAPAPPLQAPLAVRPLVARGAVRVPLSSMRKAIATRMAQAKREVPHFYLVADVDAAGLVRLREELAAAGEKVSFNDVLIKAAAFMLARHPGVNASFDGDAIARHGEVHVGMAVAVPPREGALAEGGGLITPVIRNADQKGIGQIAREARELIERARTRKLRPEEYTGATFSISNLGMYGITEFTAIINPPEAAILAVGSILDVPVVKGDAIVPGKRMKMTLSGDHRVIDGASGAEFLRDLKAILETPSRMLL
jgi:pyruvate dehydrogenase E2 component (dihydrolipoamide acetyltransferase)